MLGRLRRLFRRRKEFLPGPVVEHITDSHMRVTFLDTDPTTRTLFYGLDPDRRSDEDVIIYVTPQEPRNYDWRK